MRSKLRGIKPEEIKSLENLGLIKSAKVNSKKWNQTKWYSIDYHEYNKLLEDRYSNSPSSVDFISTKMNNPATSYGVSSVSSFNTQQTTGNLPQERLKTKRYSKLILPQENHQISQDVKFTEITPIINKNTQKKPRSMHLFKMDKSICSK